MYPSNNLQDSNSRFAWLKTKKGRIIIVIAIIAVALFILYKQENVQNGSRPLTEGEQMIIKNMIEGDKNPPVVPVTEKQHAEILNTIESDNGQTGGVGALNEGEQQSVLNQIQAE